MTSAWFPFTLSVWILCMILTIHVPLLVQGQRCEDGWIQFNDYDQKSLCVLVVEEPAGWMEARKICDHKLANLAYLDRFRIYTYYNQQQQQTSIADVLFEKNMTEFWSGLYIENGRLMWDDYGPQLARRPKYGGTHWNWRFGQPDPGSGRCGLVTIDTRQADNGFSVPSGTLSVALTDCRTTRPFICQKSPIELQVNTTSFCPENWAGNQYLPNCYSIIKEPVTHSEADRLCQKEGGQLAPSLSAFDQNFLIIVYKFFAAFDKYFEVTRVDLLWVQDSNFTRSCRSFNATKILVELDCETKLLFMCAKPTIFFGFGKLAMDSPYFNQEELLQYNPFQILPVYGYYDRILREGETIFVQTPSFILNSSLAYYQWDFRVNTNGWRVEESERVLAPYYVNISIPYSRDEFSRKKRGFSAEGSGLSTPYFTTAFTTPYTNLYVNYDSVRRTTGNYTFGVYNVNPPRYEELESRLVRYSERYLYIYVVYLDFQEGVIQPRGREGMLSREDLISFNLLQDDTYIEMLREIGSTYALLDYTPKSLNGLVRYYGGHVEEFVKDTVKFRIFVAPQVIENTPAGFEQVVLYAVENHFKEFASNSTFKTEALRVFSTVRCPFTETAMDGRNLTFNPTRVGERGFSWERCYPGNKALAVAQCNGGYDDGVRWDDITLTEGCGVVPQLNQSESTVSLKNLSETTLTQDNAKEVIENAVQLTDPKQNLTEADIIYTAEILYHYLEFDLAYTPEVLQNVYKVVNNVLKSSPDVIDSAQRITNAANRIILSVDELTNSLKIVGVDVLQFVQNLVLSEIREQDGDGPLTIGINLNQTGSTEIQKGAISSVQRPSDVAVTETDTAIYLTEALLRGQETRLTFQIYGNPSLFSVLSSRFKVNSKVAAARLTRNDAPVLQLGDEHVTAVFHPFEKSDRLVCAYWNYTKNEDAGGWETAGCTLISYEAGHVVCRCNHLTNFAVLIDQRAYTISETDKLVLGIITKIGLIISIIGLGITIVTFLVFKHLRNGRGQQVLVNLSVAMVCSDILYLVGVDRTESYGGCIAVAVLLHYFILVTFMWMLVEGVLQYLRFVKVLGTYIPNFMIKSMIPAWGVPLIPIIVCLIVDYDMYYGGKGYCWLSWKPFLYAFLIPVAVIIFVNLIVFFMVLCNLCCRRKHKGMASNQSERKMAFLHFQAAVSILVILGLTWVFGFLTVDDTRIVFHYLFAIFNAFQGLFIFLLFTAREKQIRKAWKKLCCREAPYKSSSSGAESQPHKRYTDTNSTGLLSKSEVSYHGSKTNGDYDNSLDFNNSQKVNDMSI